MTTVTTSTTATAPATDRARFRGLLETERADCVRQRTLALAETVTSVPDPVSLSRAAGLLRTIEEIDAALERMDAGSYGRCVRCGSDIAVERLELRPFASGCVPCQQAR